MTPHAPLAIYAPIVSRPQTLDFRYPDFRHLGTSLLHCFIFLVAITIPTSAQTPQQQYVYASVPLTTKTSEVASFSQDAATGVLSTLANPATPDNLEGGLLAVDAKGRFLFILNSTTSKISMFNIDSSTGSLTEVPASPFSIGITASYPQAPTSPSCLAIEPSGQFLYVGFGYGNINGMGAINAFQIDSANLQLLALPIQPTTDIASSPIGLVSAFKGRFLYAGLGLNRATGTQSGETSVYQIDPVTGQLNSTGFAGNAQGLGRSIAVDPVGRFFFEGWGQTAGHIDAAPISAVDGTATTNVATLNLNSGELPQALLPESTGKFLYVQQTSGVAAYSIDGTTGVLTQTQSPSQLFSFHTGHAVADPIGPYIYALENDGIHAFQVNPQAGALSELPNSPFPTGGNGNAGIAISGTPSSVQAVSGPAAALFPSSQSLGSVTVGQPSATRVVSATNTGDQVLLLAKISISGPNAGDFSDTTTCAVSLQPNNSCSVSITFTSTAAGLRQATLTITDNAPGSSQNVALTGTGLAQQPDVAFVFYNESGQHQQRTNCLRHQRRHYQPAHHFHISRHDQRKRLRFRNRLQHLPHCSRRGGRMRRKCYVLSPGQRSPLRVHRHC